MTDDAIAEQAERVGQAIERERVLGVIDAAISHYLDYPHLGEVLWEVRRRVESGEGKP